MQRKISLKVNKYIYYGWVILALSIVGTFFSSPGQTYSISAFIDSYIKEFGYSRTMIASIYSGATVLSGSLIIFMGKSVDRFGQRAMLVLSGVMLAISCFFNSFIINIPMVFIGFFLLRYFGQGSLPLITGSLVPQWFDKRRALALSLLSMGNILGNMIVPIINTYIIQNYGWQFAWRGWSILVILVFVPLMGIFVVDKPEDIGLLPDNQVVNSQEDIDKELAKVEKSSFTLSEAKKTKEFWFIGIISMLVPMISTGMMFHFFSLMNTKNIDATSTSFIIGLIAIPGFFVPIFAGTVIDRFRPKYIMSITSALIGVNLLYMLAVDKVYEAGIFIFIYGFLTAIQMVTVSVIWVKYFGRLHLGSIRGAATVFVVVGSALGTVPFGLSYDITGGYSAVFILMAVIAFLGTAMSLSIQKPVKDSNLLEKIS